MKGALLLAGLALAAGKAPSTNVPCHDMKEYMPPAMSQAYNISKHNGTWCVPSRLWAAAATWGGAALPPLRRRRRRRRQHRRGGARRYEVAFRDLYPWGPLCDCQQVRDTRALPARSLVAAAAPSLRQRGQAGPDHPQSAAASLGV